MLLTLHPHMWRVGEIFFVGVRSDQIYPLAPVTIPVVLVPQFNRLASFNFFTQFSTLRKGLHHALFSTQKLSPSLGTPAVGMFFPP